MNIEIGQFALLLSWREGLLALVVLIALYMVVVVWRMRRLKRLAARALESVEPRISPAAGAAAYAATANDDEVELPPPETTAHPTIDRDELAAVALAQRRCQSELAQMREELDALRGEFAGLREDLRHEAAQMKAAQSVSPLYSDAMQMASTGHSAAKIAERCGISRAEAELVVALVKSQT